nr:hypothetical protein [Tanacetum cinerariifolium]
MSTQQDIYVAGSESRPPMLNKENYVPWPSRLLQYAKSRPNGKLIHNSILNGPYVRRMIDEPGDAERDVNVNETFHEEIDDELYERELKQIEADDQAIQTILLGLPEDIYATEKMAKLFNEWERFTSNEGELIESYYHRFMKLMNDLKRNKCFPEKIASNLKFLNNLQPEWSRHVAQNPRVQNDGIQNQIGNGNLVAVRAEGNAAGHNRNQIRCYNCRGVRHFARDCTVRPKRMDAAYLQTQLLIAQKEEAGIQLQAKDALVYDSDGSAEVHENCDNNEIFNMFTQEEQYTELLEPIPEPHQVPQNDNNVISEQPIAEILSKIGETNALSKPVTSNSVSKPPVSKGVTNAKVIAPDMFRISPDKVYKEAKKVPNTVSASSRTKSITVSQPSVITKKNVNSDLNVLSSTGLDNTKTRRPQPRSNTKNDRVPSASKSSRSKNKKVKVEEHHRNLLLSKKNKHISSTCNNSKIDSQDVISKVVCVVCKKGLNSVNHDVCLNNCVNGKQSRGRKHKANVSKNETQKKYWPKVSKPKNVGTHKSLTTPKPRKPRFLLRWSPIGKMFDSDGKLVVPSNSESHVDCSNGDNACTSNAMEPKIKRFPNSTYSLGRLSRFVCGASIHVVLST